MPVRLYCSVLAGHPTRTCKTNFFEKAAIATQDLGILSAKFGRTEYRDAIGVGRRAPRLRCCLRRRIKGRREIALEANRERIFLLVVADINASSRMTLGGRIERPFDVY